MDVGRCGAAAASPPLPPLSAAGASESCGALDSPSSDVPSGSPLKKLDP
jgi:hypothetical protein